MGGNVAGRSSDNHKAKRNGLGSYTKTKGNGLGSYTIQNNGETTTSVELGRKSQRNARWGLNEHLVRSQNSERRGTSTGRSRGTSGARSEFLANGNFNQDDARNHRKSSPVIKKTVGPREDHDAGKARAAEEGNRSTHSESNNSNRCQTNTIPAGTRKVMAEARTRPASFPKNTQRNHTIPANTAAQRQLAQF